VKKISGKTGVCIVTWLQPGWQNQVNMRNPHCFGANINIRPHLSMKVSLVLNSLNTSRPEAPETLTLAHIRNKKKLLHSQSGQSSREKQQPTNKNSPQPINQLIQAAKTYSSDESNLLFLFVATHVHMLSMNF